MAKGGTSERQTIVQIPAIRLGVSGGVGLFTGCRLRGSFTAGRNFDPATFRSKMPAQRSEFAETSFSDIGGSADFGGPSSTRRIESRSRQPLSRPNSAPDTTEHHPNPRSERPISVGFQAGRTSGRRRTTPRIDILRRELPPQSWTSKADPSANIGSSERHSIALIRAIRAHLCGL